MQESRPIFFRDNAWSILRKYWTCNGAIWVVDPCLKTSVIRLNITSSLLFDPEYFSHFPWKTHWLPLSPWPSKKNWPVTRPWVLFFFSSLLLMHNDWKFGKRRAWLPFFRHVQFTCGMKVGCIWNMQNVGSLRKNNHYKTHLRKK